MYALAVLLAASSSKNTTSGGSATASLLFIVIIFAAGYFFFVRPRSQAARRQRDTLMDLGTGDEVLTGAGIFGRVLDVESDRVTIETAPGTRITVLRSTIARRISPTEEERIGDGGWSDDEHHEHDHHDEHGDASAHDHADDHADDHAESDEAGHDDIEPGSGH